MGEPFLEGCMDQTACNYNADATIDDDTCTFAQENYDCNGTCIATNPSDCCDAGVTPDCNGTCGGSAIEDCTGTCNGNAVVGGCDNLCNSILENDACNVCGGDDSTCNISYSEFVKPTFISYCTLCHISGSSGGLSLINHSTLMNGGGSGAVIIPSNGSGSLLIQKLRGTSGDQMPASGCCLDESDIQLIETWIDEGALNN